MKDDNKYKKRKDSTLNNTNFKKNKTNNFEDELYKLLINIPPKLPSPQLSPNIITEESIVFKEYIVIKKEIKDIQDLIDLGNMYDETKDYNICMKTLSNLVKPLIQLNGMIGMKQLKDEIVDHILFRIQKLDNDNNDILHTILQGPPGVGKTEVAQIIASIYLGMGILKNNKFIKVKRSDLIAGYLGQTAKLTQNCIDTAIGGVLFIDEVYSLGNKQKSDSFSKECIDTLTENLTEKKKDFICIIAGYKKEIEECFFAYNNGLERRFPVRFTIDKYSGEELFEIFKKKVNEINWQIDNSITSQFFIDKYDYFNFFGGDIEVLLSRCKIYHSRRIFNCDSTKKILNIKDLEGGFDIFKNNKTVNIKEESWRQMFL